MLPCPVGYICLGIWYGNMLISRSSSTLVGRQALDPSNWCARCQQGNNLSVATENAPGSGVNLDKIRYADPCESRITRYNFWLGQTSNIPKFERLRSGGARPRLGIWVSDMSSTKTPV